MAFLPRSACVLFLLLWVLVSVSAAGPDKAEKASEGGDVERFADVRVNDSDALLLIKAIRKDAPSKSEAAVWVRVANSDTYSRIRRRQAIFQVFDRHVRKDMTLGELAVLLAKPSWLKRENVVEIGRRAAYGPGGRSVGLSLAPTPTTASVRSVCYRVSLHPIGRACICESKRPRQETH